MCTYVHIQVDHWMEYSLSQLTQQSATPTVLAQLDAVMASRMFLVGYHFSLADIAVYSSIQSHPLPYMYHNKVK